MSETAELDVVDRGDNLDTLKDDTPAPEVEKEVDEKIAELTDDKDKDDADEQPRDKSGKFAKKDDQRIPKDRFDEAVGKERAAREAAERRAAELEAQVKKEAQDDTVAKMEEAVEKLESQHAKLLLDGEHEKAAAVMKQIRHAEREIARYEADDKVSRATAQAVEQVRMEAAIARLEADFPVLNQDSENYDQDLVDLVLAEQQRLMRTERMAPSAALASAATKIMKKFTREEAPAADAKGLAAAKNADRKAEQIARNISTDKRQPASTASAGKDSDRAGQEKIDPTKLTPSEFAALPESTKKKLRGDDV